MRSQCLAKWLVEIRSLLFGAFFLLFLPLFSKSALADEYERGRASANAGKFNEALSIWKPLAEQGDSRAQTGIGLLYARGDGVALNYTEAVKWFERASQSGNHRAEGILGKMFWFGDGVSKDQRRAVQFLRKAAAAGDLDAQDMLETVKASSADLASPVAALPQTQTEEDILSTAAGTYQDSLESIRAQSAPLENSAPPSYDRSKDSFDVSAPVPARNSVSPKLPLNDSEAPILGAETQPLANTATGQNGGLPPPKR